LINDGYSKYGASGFENMIRTNPNKTKEFVNEFADRLISKDSGGIKTEFNNQKANLNKSGVSDIEANYNTNKNTFSNLANDNKNKVKTQAPKNFQENVVKTTDGGIKRKVNQDLAKKDLKLKSKKLGINTDSDKLVNKVINQNEKSATGVLVDAWRKPEDNNK
jgi:hypothetical protein